MEDAYAELEIGIHRIHAEAYQIDLRFIDPDSDTEIPSVRRPFPLDEEKLLELQLDPREYGRELAAQLFHAPEALSFFQGVKVHIEGKDISLRVRLLVGTSASKLHGLRWELMADPLTAAPFASSEKILFSRFMVSRDWRPVRLRPKAGLRALVAIAAPANIDRYKLAPVDIDGEIDRAQKNLASIDIEVAGKDQPLTLRHLNLSLRKGVDILYLVCHGVLGADGEPYLFLQDDEGLVKRVSGEDLALRIGEMVQMPRLVLLASCQSAGTGEPPSKEEKEKRFIEVPLATRLADVGVPAILAMQGKISMETIEKMMPVFFQELLVDGRIDRAMAVARGVVRERPDAWMPALFLRLKGGYIWYEPGFGKGEEDSVKWKALVNDISQKRFTPVIGWGLGESVYGSTSRLAGTLAESNHLRLAPYQCADLALVSQYLLVNQNSSDFPLDALKEQMRKEIAFQYGSTLGDEFRDASLGKLLTEIGRLQRQNELNPFRVLASLPAKVFVTASPDTLLTQALQEAGKNPETRFAFWKQNLQPPAPYDREPTVKEPLVFHIFGHFKEPDSLVLTEDDYLDYLIGASKNRALVPEVVRSCLANSSLLFLGFQICDWSFRVLFRLIMSQGGSSRLKRYAHTAVQVDPEGDLLKDAEEARKYLKDYYGSENISIFWGGSDEFLRQLHPRLPDLSSLAEDEDGDDF